MSAIQQHAMLLAGSGAALNLWTPRLLTVPPSILCDYSTAMTVVTGTTVSAWADGSGAGNNLTQSLTSSYPDYLAADSNGYPAVAPTNASQADYLTSAATSIYQNAAQGWIMCVYRMRGSGATNRILGAAATASSGSARLWLCSDSTTAAAKPNLRVRRLDADAVAVLSGPTALNDGSYHMVLGTINWGTRAAALYVDGSSVATNATLTASAGNTSNTASATVTALGDGGSTTDSAVSALLFGTTIPSSGDIDKLFGLYAYVYGLQSLLPVGHPYKTSPPTA